jgi:SIR2-like protein
MRRVAVIGNGLSVSASLDFRLAPLTTAVRNDLDALGGGLLQRLDAAGALLVPDRHAFNPTGNFEHLLGPLDRLAILLRGPLLQIVGQVSGQQPALQAAADAVDELYVRGVGVVLRVVDSRALTQVPIRTVVDWMLGGLGPDDEASVYTVNYDSLLDRWLLDARSRPGDHPHVRLDDEFAALTPQSERVVVLPGVGIQDLRLIPLRPADLPRPGTVHLYHLHGASHWVDHEGETWKARDIDDLRTRNVFVRWAAGEALPIRPRLILTDQKARAVALEPFARSYAALGEDLSKADRVMIAGYSFGDVPLNEVLARGWRTRTNTSSWLVVDHANLAGRFRKRRKVQTELRARVFAAGPSWYWDGLPRVADDRPDFWTS